jgi:hypothetical protein
MSWAVGYITSRQSMGRQWNLSLRWNLRNWALPIGFGGACWEDPELGDYGQRYGCDYYWGFILRVLCVSLEFNWMLE